MSSPAVAQPIAASVSGKPPESQEVGATHSILKSSSFPLPAPTTVAAFSASSSFSSSSSPPASTSAFLSHFPTLPRAAPVVDSSHATRQLCQQTSLLLTALTAPPVLADIDGIEQQIQASLARLDEYAALVAAYSAVNESVSAALLPQLSAAGAGLPALFARMDRLLDYVEHVEGCCDALEQRVQQAEAAYGPQKTSSVTKLFSSLLRKAGASSGSSGGESGVSGAAVAVSTEPIGIVSADDFFVTHTQQQQQQQRIS